MTRTPRARRALAYGAAAGALLIAAPAASAQTGCDTGSIEALDIAGVSVVSARTVASAGATPAYCDVIGQLNTQGYGAPAGSAGFELRLPSGWNQKFLFFGVGGLAGSTYADIAAGPVDTAEALAKHYATAITDTGHLAGGTDASWALIAPGEPAKAKLADYYFRATHEVTLAGQKLAAAFYGQTLKESYFDGCSNGGRQAMMEASRFPTDYDGIIAGDPFFDIRSIVNGVHVAKQLLTGPQTYIPASLLPVIDAAVTASCDAVDGVRDGLIQNPAACSFSAFSLVCAPGQTTGCLTEPQAESLDQYWTATRENDGRLVYPGFTVSNLATSASGALTGGGMDVWTTGFTPPVSFTANEPWGDDGFGNTPVGFQFADHIMKDIYARNPNYDARSFPVTADGFIGAGALASFDRRTQAGDANDPRAFATFLGSGRKLLIYHGFSDPALTPFRTINFYEQLAAMSGGYKSLQSGAELFLVPGMQHCIGGPGPNVFDTLTPLEQWVEHGQAPAAIPAAHYVNDDPAKSADRTMPLCPFPTQATYTGSGDVNSAANWSCAPNRKLLRIGSDGVKAGADNR